MENSEQTKITTHTIIQFLFGKRDAILKVAECPDSLRVSFILVMVAALARSYDKEYLFREPLHLLLSPVASALVAFLIFLAFRLLSWRHAHDCPKFWRDFKVILSLFWMTAPLAWVYGIPVEIMFDGFLSMQINLWLLLVVAVWRVLLFIRIMNVIYGGYSLVVVLMICGSIAYGVLDIVPMPIISFMGGVTITGTGGLIRLIGFLVVAICIIAVPITALLYLVSIFTRIGSKYSGYKVNQDITYAKTVFKLPILISILFIFCLPYFQPKQANRYTVETLFSEDKITQALEYLKSHKVEDFPRHWTLPPQWKYRKKKPDMLTIMRELQKTDEKSWVKDYYFEDFKGYFGFFLRPHHHSTCEKITSYYSVIKKLKPFYLYTSAISTIEEKCPQVLEEESQIAIPANITSIKKSLQKL
ncbi:MAG: hypothetical protein KC646_07905 [Candidatus Cloacimonetes bacterium]|nr:hypothetical protein [Candidatus Cloacimonadota bacterium]